MEALTNKIDFAVVFEVRNANPNGDPLSENRPRQDADGYGEVSDVCIKRKIRNRLTREGVPVFVQSDDNKVDDCTSLSKRYEKHMNVKAAADIQAAEACKTWFDVRAFGQLFAYKGSEKTGVSIGIRGPVSIQPAFTVEPVVSKDTQITKSVNSEESKGGKSSDTMGMKHRVNFGVYRTFGSINAELSKKTGFSDADAEVLKNMLLTLFRDDESSARPAGSMTVKKVIWWKHNCPSGQYSSARVFDSLKIERKEGVSEARSFDDYQMTVNKLEGLDFEEFDGE